MSNSLLPLVRNLSIAYRQSIHSSQERRQLTIRGELTQEAVDRDHSIQAAFRERLEDLFLQANLEDIKEQTEDAEAAAERGPDPMDLADEAMADAYDADHHETGEAGA